jgi:hypothetical protein
VSDPTPIVKRMSNWLGYESVYSFQINTHRHWCHINAFILAENVMMKQDLGAGDEAVTEAFGAAEVLSLGAQEVRQTLVAMASTDGREIVSFGYDDRGLVASVIYQPRGELRFDPVWVPRSINKLFVELLDVLEKSALPFPDHDET